MINSSTDIQGLSYSFVQADRSAQDQIFARRQNEYNLLLKAYSGISSKMTDFQGILETAIKQKSMESNSVTLSEEGFATVTADSNAVSGSYEINIAQKASAHQIALDFASETDPVPTSGVVTLDLGGTSFSIDMSTLGTGADLSTFRDAVNNHVDNPGMSASIVRVDGGVKLMLSSDTTGASNVVSITTNGDPALADFDTAIAGQQQIRAASDATIYMGANQEITLTSTSNTFKNVIDGVTIDIQKLHETATDTLTFTVGQDVEATKDNAQKFVDGYNALIKELDKHGEGALKTNSGLRMINSQMSREISSFNLMSVGIEIDRYGKMSIDETAFKEALDADPNALSKIFSGETGLLSKLDERVDTYIKGSKAFIPTSKEMVQSRLDSLQDQMTRFDKRMEQTYNRYVSQFSKMQGIISQMQQTSGLFQ